MAKTITVIPASLSSRFSNLAMAVPARRRVAAYARVSTDSEEQQTSYEAQVDYYTHYIKGRGDWEFVSVYADEGITGCNTKKRDGFNHMISDALAGKIDLIITKSVSRFARNTVDSLSTIRKLKERNVECYFEKENIWTFDSKGELLITIMSSLAQEESRSISENVTWGMRRRIADGKVSMAYGQFLGYEKGPDGAPKVVEKEAKVVREIYQLFLRGKTPTAIARYLTRKGIATPGGKEKWQGTVVESILTNEKYKGDALLQKTFTTDFLTKKVKVNEGEVPQYYVTDSHEGIIAPEDFELVQAEMARRKLIGPAYRCGSPFSSKIVCGDCGGFYGPKVWHSTDKYRRVKWRCNAKYKKFCGTPTLDEEDIKGHFMSAWLRFRDVQSSVIAGCRAAIDSLDNTTSIDSEIAEKNAEAEMLIKMNRRNIQDNASSAQDQTAYEKRHKELVDRYDALTERINRLKAKKEKRAQQRARLIAFVHTLLAQSDVSAFDEQLWLSVVEKATVYSDGRITFTFINGSEIDG